MRHPPHCRHQHGQIVSGLHPPKGSLFHQSEALISDILGHPTKAPFHLPRVVSALATAAHRPQWHSVDNIDVSLHCRTLFRSIDLANFSLLLDSASDVLALAFSSPIPHAGDWLNVVPSTALSLHLLDQGFRLCLRY